MNFGVGGTLVTFLPMGPRIAGSNPPHTAISLARGARSDGSISGSAGPGFDPRPGSKFFF